MPNIAKYLLLAMTLFVPAFLQSCIDGDDEDYQAWRDVNDAYINSLNLNEYEKVAPDWAPLNPVYIKWHNDRTLTKDNLVPMSTSTITMKYELEDINGTKIENTYARQDSAYTCKPNQNVIGMWIALTTMHVGDSVTLVIPYSSGYGAEIRSSMKPFTDLIFHMKLKSITAFEKQ
ncbi:MAG: FKBP-type peptidyl-prolyl cis-trans isomerase [Muribaculaceae bacterium]|nr:FKBP-type peptidyl-prolyl cis-trans isomerase [Muribaculaceae bacterium]